MDAHYVRGDGQPDLRPCLFARTQEIHQKPTYCKALETATSRGAVRGLMATSQFESFAGERILRTHIVENRTRKRQRMQCN